MVHNADINNTVDLCARKSLCFCSKGPTSAQLSPPAYIVHTTQHMKKFLQMMNSQNIDRTHFSFKKGIEENLFSYQIPQIMIFRPDNRMHRLFRTDWNQMTGCWNNTFLTKSQRRDVNQYRKVPTPQMYCSLFSLLVLSFRR